MIRRVTFVFFLIVILVACSSNVPRNETPASTKTPFMSEPTRRPSTRPINSAYLPKADDGKLTRGNVFIDDSQLLVMESYPVQIALALRGSLPTPCNQLRVIANPPDEQNRIQVEVYSVIDPEQLCAQVLEPFEANIGLGSFPAGHYSVWVNGEMAGEFDA